MLQACVSRPNVLHPFLNLAAMRAPFQARDLSDSAFRAATLEAPRTPWTRTAIEIPHAPRAAAGHHDGGDPRFVGSRPYLPQQATSPSPAGVPHGATAPDGLGPAFRPCGGGSGISECTDHRCWWEPPASYLPGMTGRQRAIGGALMAMPTGTFLFAVAVRQCHCAEGVS